MKTPGRLSDLLVGGIAGGIVGAVVSVNLVIFSGVDDGYQASPGAVLGHNPAVGLLALVVMIGAPVMGVILARRRRTRIQ